MNAEVLNSWKEIAAYLGRGVRTVQRWEQELGLPVRRPRGKERSAVIALKPDLDVWLHSVPRNGKILHDETVDKARTGAARSTMKLNADEMIKRAHELLERSLRMQETVKSTVALATLLKTQHAQHRVEFKSKISEQRSLMHSFSSRRFYKPAAHSKPEMTRAQRAGATGTASVKLADEGLKD